MRRPPPANRGGRVGEERSLPGREGGERVRANPPPNVRIAPEGPEPRAGRVDQHAVEGRSRTAAGAPASTRAEADPLRAAQRRTVAFSNASRRGRRSVATSVPRPAMSPAMATVLPPGGGAEVEHPHAGSRRGQRGDELGRLVLHPEGPFLESGRSVGAPSAATSSPVSRPAAGRGVHAPRPRGVRGTLVAGWRGAGWRGASPGRAHCRSAPTPVAASSPWRSSQRSASQRGCDSVMAR